MCTGFYAASVSAQTPTPIELADLPPPPEEILARIQAGRANFEAGPREASAEPQGGPRVAAETKYRIEYNYSSRSRWKLERDNGRVVISVRFFRITWKPFHTIWFRNPPAREDFWSNALVRHELDHLRISSDPRLATRFEQLLREQSVIRHAVSEGDVVNREFVDRLVDQHVAEVFAEITDLVSIRYQELDRVTRHGLDPVPGDSPLQALLRPASRSEGD